MAEKQLNTPKTNGKVEVTLPPGMTEAQFSKLFSSFNKMREYTAKRDECVRHALTNLRDKHRPEYDVLLTAELRQAGLPIKAKA